jgi:23S rRNA pseudouridine955/2504/2580 synthase
MKWLASHSEKLVPFLQGKLDPSPSGKQLRRVLEANLCRVNGCIERFGSREVGKGSVVELSPDWQTEIESPKIAIQFPILYEDEELLIIDKPAGWVCEERECRKAFGPTRYLVHRLDKDTTGVLLIAKTRGAEQSMLSLFKERQIEKLYFAIVDGVPLEERGVIKSHLAKVGRFEGQTCWGSRSTGLLAETHWKVWVRGDNCALLACQPLTGRTHQIRVHLAEMGHPILIDRQYAKRFRCKQVAKRPLLHAGRVCFRHPVGGQLVDVSAPLPSEFFLGKRDAFL